MKEVIEDKLQMMMKSQIEISMKQDVTDKLAQQANSQKNKNNKVSIE